MAPKDIVITPIDPRYPRYPEQTGGAAGRGLPSIPTKWSYTTEDLQKIHDYLSNLKTSYGVVPEYLQKLSKNNGITGDSSKWGYNYLGEHEFTPQGWDYNTGEYGYLPANQFESNIPASETEFEEWLKDLYSKEGMHDSTDVDLHNIFGLQNEGFRPHEREMQITAPYLPYLASKEGGYNTELDLGGVWPNRKFFPQKGYPEIPLDALQKLIDSGEEVGMDVPSGAAGIYRGEKSGTGIWDMDLSDEYADDLATLSQVAGHESGHLATESDLYPYFWENAPNPFAFVKEGPYYDLLKEMSPERAPPSKHFSTQHKFHPSLHGIDEQFFGGYGQPNISTSLKRVTPMSKGQVENMNYIMNKTVQDERNDSLASWYDFQKGEEEDYGGRDYMGMPTTPGPVGMGHDPNWPRRNPAPGPWNNFNPNLQQEAMRLDLGL